LFGWGWLKRINRAQYWLALFILVAVNITLSILMHGRALGEWAFLIVCVPRLHDIGRSGWWFGAAILLEIVGGVLGAMSIEPLDLVLGVIVLVEAGLLIWLGAIKGQLDSNRFGEPPLPGLQGWWKQKAPQKVADVFD